MEKKMQKQRLFKHKPNAMLVQKRSDTVDTQVVRKRKRGRFTTSSVLSVPVSSVSAFSGFTAATNASSLKPKRSTASLLLNGSIMYGREFCYAVEASLTTPILLGIGLPVHLYSLIWVISPVLGFVLQPILGNMSDRCSSEWGRRRPFILIVSMLLVVGMTLFLNGQQIVEYAIVGDSPSTSDNRSGALWAITLVIIGVVVFDFSADFVEGPIRAYVMDVCDKEDVKRGLYYQAIFTGLGGAFGYGSAGVSWIRDFKLGRYFPTDQQVVYLLAMVIFTCCVVMNLTSITEKRMARKNPTHRQRKFKPAVQEIYPMQQAISAEFSEKMTRKNKDRDETNVLYSGSIKKEKKIFEKHIDADKSHRKDVNIVAPSTSKSTQFPQKTSPSKATGNVPPESVLGDSVVDSKNYTAQWVNKSRKWSLFGADLNKSRRMLPCVEDQAASYGTFIATDSDSSLSSRDSNAFDIPPPLQLKHNRISEIGKTHNEHNSGSSDVNDDKTSYHKLPERSGHDQHASDESVFDGVRRFFASIRQTPREIKHLCMAHLFGWMGFLCLVLFFTDFVGQSVYGGDPLAPPGTAKGNAYKRGVEFGSWGMAVNAASSSVYCFLLKPMIRIFGARTVYVFGYFAFSIGALGMTLWRDATLILLLSSLIGVMSGTLYTLPYFLVSKYHESYRRFKGTSLERGVGTDCALVTCMIQLAQIIVGLGIGALVTWLNTVAVTVAAASLISFVGSIYVLLFVKC